MQMAACTADHGICHRIAQAGSRTAECNHTLTNPHLGAERNLASMNSVPIKRNRGNSTGRSQNHPNMGCSKLVTSGTKLAARAGGLGRRPSPTLCSLLAPKGVGLLEPLRDYGALPELSETDMLQQNPILHYTTLHYTTEILTLPYVAPQHGQGEQHAPACCLLSRSCSHW
jgi:hypothetical protein